MKKNPIIIGFDDASFELKGSVKKTQLIGVVCQGIRMVDVVRSEILIDGNDATEKLIELVKKKEKHIQYILTHTITFGGFNLINLDHVYKELNKPIIAVNDRKVDIEAVITTLKKKFPQSYKPKIQNIVNAGNLYSTKIVTAGGSSNIFFHSKGIDINEIDLLLQQVSIDSKLPECVRLAHLIGRLF